MNASTEEGKLLDRLMAELPPLNVRHLRRMTDSTGMLQHARFGVPDREHGYCVDDNARALVVACWGRELTGSPTFNPLIGTYLAFLNHAFINAAGRFRNFMTYERTWPESAGSEESHGRAIWGLGVASVSAATCGERALAERLVHEGTKEVERFTSLRAWAFAVLGLDAYLEGHPHERHLEVAMSTIANMLHQRFSMVETQDWPWCEEYLTYDNAVIPRALLLSACRLSDDAMKRTALRSLGWLIDLQTGPDGHLTLIGNNGWMWHGREEERAQFDQQPLDAATIALACADAYLCTREIEWIERMVRAVKWFTGHNDVGEVVYDRASGGGYDGLHSTGVNVNLGAESTLAWLMTRIRAEMLARAVRSEGRNVADAAVERREPTTDGNGNHHLSR
ncbi:MAG TPA: hypothetical protein VHI13_08195 [Candidatus Kapabacteria bacterium]|nr:hypothetical protein [Candidatus Kapabacteria bacterium]